VFQLSRLREANAGSPTVMRSVRTIQSYRLNKLGAGVLRGASPLAKSSLPLLVEKILEVD
jgi:hypothetical protein